MPKKVKTATQNNWFVLVVLISLLITTLNFALFTHTQLATKVLGAQTQATIEDTTPLLSEKAFWQQMINEHPSYRDAYIELSDIENKLGNARQSEELLNLARGIDPNYNVY